MHDQESGEAGKLHRADSQSEMETHSTLSAAPKYPEHEKLQAKRHESHVLSGFLDMLDERKLFLGHYHEHSDECTKTERKLFCCKREHRTAAHHNNSCFYDDVTHICGLNDVALYRFDVPRKEQLIGLYLDIDPKKLSAEKDAMYQELVAANAQRASEQKGTSPNR